MSEQVARAEALEESREPLRLAVEATGIGLWTWDVVSDQIHWDRQAIESSDTTTNVLACRE